MLTVVLILAVVIGAVALVGGVAMMFDNKGDFWTWYLGYNAMKAGFEILGYIVPAIVEAVAEASK